MRNPLRHEGRLTDYTPEDWRIRRREVLDDYVGKLGGMDTATRRSIVATADAIAQQSDGSRSATREGRPSARPGPGEPAALDFSKFIKLP